LMLRRIAERCEVVLTQFGYWNDVGFCKDFKIGEIDFSESSMKFLSKVPSCCVSRKVKRGQ
jgi:hypothetical protein